MSGAAPSRWPVVVLAAALAAAAAAVQARELGRLFTTPAQRAALDQARRDYDPQEAAAAKQAAAGPVVREVTVNGLVLRSSGHNAAWLNGEVMLGDRITAEGVRVETESSGGGSVHIVIPGAAGSVRLRPGQKIEVTEGRVLDAWQRAAGRPPHAAGAEAGSAAPPGAAPAPAGQ